MAVPAGQIGENLLRAWFTPVSVAAREAEVRARAESVLEFLHLDHLRDERAANLSGGQKKLLELGRAMMAEARLVLLDEPGAGVNPTLLGELANMILHLNQDRGYTFCIIEHNMDMIARLCDPVIVMAEGTVLTEGKRARSGATRGCSTPISRRPSGVSDVLHIDRLSGGYGETDILHEVSLTVPAGKIVAVIGPNGAGKSTAIKAVFGLLHLFGRPHPARGRRHHRPGARQGGAARRVLRAPIQQRIRQSHGRGEPRNGRVRARRRFSPADRRDLRHVPRPRAQAAAGGGDAIGRPAPNAGARQGADAGAKTLVAR